MIKNESINTKNTPIYSGKSGYSDIVEISDNKIGILYEGGKKRYTDGLDFKIIDLNSIP